MLNIAGIFLLPFLTSALICFLSVPLIIRYAEKLKIIDDPKTHIHPSVIHKVPTPRGGGIALFLGIAITALLFLPLDKHLAGILLGGLVLVVMGFLDDKHSLNPYKRLFVQFLVAGIPIAAGIGIAYIRLPFLATFINDHPQLHNLILTDPKSGIIDLSQPRIFFDFLGKHSIWILSDIFALFWIVVLMNFINIGASGLDGQLSGTILVAALVIGALSLRYSADITQWPVIILAASTAGAYTGFLFWHKYPQKIMPGFGGSTLAGFMLGVLSILSTTKVGTLMLILALPLIDTGYVILKRLSQGKAPLWGDRGHLHHKLLDAGFTKKQVAFVYWATTALLGIIALNLTAENKFYSIIGFAIILGGIILLLSQSKKT